MESQRQKRAAIILVVIGVTAVFFFGAVGVQAEEGIKFVPQVSIPGSGFTRNVITTINSSTIANYIASVYRYGVGLVAALAVLMIMVGGFQWIFAVGNPSKIGAAKGIIASALVGLFLALGSVMLLKTINPDLVTLSSLTIETPKVTVTGCPGLVTNCGSINTLALPDGGYKGYTEVNKFRQYVCTQAIYSDKCGLPPGLCWWVDSSNKKTNSATAGSCKSLLDIPCSKSGQNSSECFGLFCETNWKNFCSLGTVGSDCAYNVECKTGYCNTHGTNYCINGDPGDECDKDAQCKSGNCKDHACVEK